MFRRSPLPLVPPNALRRPPQRSVLRGDGDSVLEDGAGTGGSRQVRWFGHTPLRHGWPWSTTIPPRHPSLVVFTSLQLGNAGGGSLVTIGAVVLIIAVVLTYWVYNDATGRGEDDATLWAPGIGIVTLLTLVGGLIGFGVYLYTRN